MLRLQDLVDKLQVKVKTYKRQAEEAVSQPPAWLRTAACLFLTVSSQTGARWPHLPGRFGFRMNKPMLISPNSGKLSMSSRRLKSVPILQNLKSISFVLRPETSPPAG